jgi:short-subunit dehydrogenase
MVLMTHHILPSMINRNRRSAIINVSSLAGQQPIPFVSNYSATKAFNNFFSQAIELEYSEQIDVLCLQPMEVETQMSGKTKSCTVASRT